MAGERKEHVHQTSAGSSGGASSGDGPDPAGRSHRRRPSSCRRLIESILNPNAMIVDGPGYTDDRGLSIMPEYRHSMTVGELVDLVSYLKGLGAP
jgi:hypothetical protein